MMNVVIKGRFSSLEKYNNVGQKALALSFALKTSFVSAHDNLGNRIELLDKCIDDINLECLVDDIIYNNHEAKKLLKDCIYYNAIKYGINGYLTKSLIDTVLS